jgi:hypothetical protein
VCAHTYTQKVPDDTRRQKHQHSRDDFVIVIVVEFSERVYMHWLYALVYIHCKCFGDVYVTNIWRPVAACCSLSLFVVL